MEKTNEQSEVGVDVIVVQSCYSCGKPTTKPSKYWPKSWVCNECNDWQVAADYAHHCVTGE